VCLFFHSTFRIYYETGRQQCTLLRFANRINVPDLSRSAAGYNNLLYVIIVAIILDALSHDKWYAAGEMYYGDRRRSGVTDEFVNCSNTLHLLILRSSSIVNGKRYYYICIRGINVLMLRSRDSSEFRRQVFSRTRGPAPPMRILLFLFDACGGYPCTSQIWIDSSPPRAVKRFSAHHPFFAKHIHILVRRVYGVRVNEN
jgi:hypothetical protein